MSDEQSVTFDISGGAADSAGDIPHARLVCLDPDLLPEESKSAAAIELVSDAKTVGRQDANDIVIRATGISKTHAKFSFEGGAWQIEDMGSTNGVFINDARTQKGAMSAGDTVKVAKIPYQFVLVKPEVKGLVDKDGTVHEEPAAAAVPDFDPDMTVSQKTMFVGSNLQAAAVLLEASAERETAEAEGDAKRGLDDTLPGDYRPQQASKASKPWGKIAAVVGIVVLVLAGGLYMFAGGSGQHDELAATNSKDIRVFIRDYEGTAETYSAGAHSEQNTVLSNLMASVMDGRNQYPESVQFQAMLAQLLFLQFERDLLNLIQSNKLDAAEDLYVATVSQFSELQAELEAAKDPKPRKIGAEVGELLKLAGPVIEIKAFAIKYADLTGTDRPAPAELERMRAERRDFTVLKRKNNLVLSITYPFFNHIVQELDRADTVLIDKWGARLR